MAALCFIIIEVIIYGGIIVPAKNSFDDVKRIIEEHNCELLSVQYINEKSPLEIIFSCRHIEFRNMDSFKRGIKHGINVCNRCQGSKKYSYQEVKTIVENNGYVLLDDEYINCDTKINIQDKNGYKYITTFERFMINVVKIKGGINKFDISNPYTIENIELLLKISDVDLFLNIGQKWSGNHTKMNFYDSDGYKYSVTFNQILNCIKSGGGLRKFDIGNIHTIDNIENWIKLNNKSYYLIKGQKYINGNKKLKFKCLRCHPDENPFETNFENLLYNEFGCNYCGSRVVGKYNNLEYIYPDIAKEWDYIKNYPVTPADVLPHSGNKYYWVCPDCDNSYSVKVCTRTDGRLSGCPKCKKSKMEKKIEKFLEQNNIRFEPQKRFFDCRDLYPLPFDFYLLEFNLLIEAQGRQHFEPVDCFGGESKFIILKTHDTIKKEYCVNKNINFLEINYKHFDDIEDILIKELKLNFLENEHVSKRKEEF
jgi:DNA-directed RNA polymerase subunit RPC12/RpoP